MAIRAPHADELERIRVPDRNAMIPVSIGSQQFARPRNEPDLGHAFHVLSIETPLAGIGPADLAQERPVLTELQDETVVVHTVGADGAIGSGRRGELGHASRRRTWLIGAVSAQPHVPLDIDRDAVIGAWPVVALGHAPVLDQVSGRIKFQNIRSCLATIRLVSNEVGFLLVQGLRAVHDPHVVARVHGYAHGHPKDPVVRQRLGPKWIHFKLWDHHLVAAVRSVSYDPASPYQYRSHHQSRSHHGDAYPEIDVSHQAQLPHTCATVSPTEK